MTAKAPKFEPHRKGIAALDASNPTKASEGVNFAGFDVGYFQVEPSSSANPTIEILSWSESLSEFISQNPPLTFTGAGADTPYEVSFPANGRILFAKVTAGALGSVDINASGRLTGDIS